MDFISRTHRTPQIDMHYAAVGDPSKPLVICLHGFPEFWVAWRGVMEALSDRYYLVAPDQRGFNLSSKPEGVDSYRAKHMVADLASLADTLSPRRPFVLAGHDWGASVAYAYAFAHPDRLSSLVIANGVHPACFQRAINDDEEQRAASQYINRLRAADAEELMSEDGFRRLFNMLAGFSRTSWMTDAVKRDYLDAWQKPGALTAMLNWYRASPIDVPAPGEPAPASKVLDIPVEALAVKMPHLVVWGEADEALRPSCIDGLGTYAPDLTLRVVSGTGHWLLHERPDEVAALIRDFLDRSA